MRPILLPLLLVSVSLPAADVATPSDVRHDSYGKAGAASAYELRGFFGTGENLEVSVRAPGSEASQWLKVGQKSGDLLVEKADAKAGVAMLVVGGRRIALRLAGEAPLSARPAASVIIGEVETIKPDYKSREYRQKRFEELREKLSETQLAEFSRVMNEGFEKINRQNSENDLSDPKNAEMGLEMRIAVVRQASEATYKLPGKDGNITPVPLDFEPLMREEFKADIENSAARRAEHEKPAVAQSGEIVR